MDHEYYKDRLSAYLDRELKPEEMRMMQEHVEGCAQCREILDDLARLDRFVSAQSGLADDEYWERAAERIEKRLEASSGDTKVTDIRRFGNGMWWKIGVAAASVGFLTFIGLHQTDILEGPVEKAEPHVVYAPSVPPHEAETSAALTLTDAHEETAVRKEEAAGTGAQGIAISTSSEMAPAETAAPVEATAAAETPAQEPEAVGTTDADVILKQPVQSQEAILNQLQAEKQKATELTRRAPAKPMNVDEFQASRASMDKETPRGKAVDEALTLEISKPAVSTDAGGAIALDTAVLRNRCDSLTGLFAARGSDLAAKAANSVDTTVDSLSLETERAMLNAWYDLAVIGDSTDTAEAKAFYEDYLMRPESRLKDAARRYLDQLTARP